VSDPKIKIRVRADNAAKVAARFGRTWQQFDHIVERRVEDAGNFMVQKIYRNRKIIPYDTGHMSRGIQWVKGGKLTIEIISTAVDPDSGFDYFPVTRFGHQTHLIVPRNQRVLREGERSILHWTNEDDNDVFSSWSRGFHPLTDWTDKAVPLAREVARRTGLLIARDIDRELSKGA